MDNSWKEWFELKADKRFGRASRCLIELDGSQKQLNAYEIRHGRASLLTSQPLSHQTKIESKGKTLKISHQACVWRLASPSSKVAKLWAQQLQIVVSNADRIVEPEKHLGPDNRSLIHAEPLLKGTIFHGIARPSRVLAVFVSSTFTDTEEERNTLIQQIPSIRAYASQLGLSFLLSEMRWGVTETLSASHKTTELCLQQLQECQTTSPILNFVSLLGNKYGFRPFPSVIPQDVFVRLVGMIKSSQAKSLLGQWFEQDSNSLPPCMLLKAIPSQLPDYIHPTDQERRKQAGRVWWDSFTAMSSALRTAALQLQRKDAAFDASPFVFSVTEDEVRHGLEDVPDPKACSIWYRRVFTDLAQHEQDTCFRSFQDVDSSKRVDVEAKGLLDDVIARMQENIEDIKEYSIPFAPQKGVDPSREDHKSYLSRLAQDFQQDMKAALDKIATHVHAEHVDPLLIELQHHLDMIVERCFGFQGRAAELDDITRYLKGASPGQPLVVAGPSGTGKTSVMAKACAVAAQALPDHVLIARFIGTSQASTSAHSIMHGICCQLQRLGLFSATGEDVSELSVQEKDELIPLKYGDLVRCFKDALEKSAATCPLVIFLDSLDQLSEDYDGKSLIWLPLVLPPNVHMVLSSLPEPMYKTMPALQAMLARSFPGEDPKMIRLEPLSAATCMVALEEWLRADSRQLTSIQRQAVQNAFRACSTPLYLRLVHQRVKEWTSSTEASLALDVPDAITDLFESLEQTHGVTLVRHALAYLTASRFGISANEMTDLLSCDDLVLNEVFEWWLPPARQVPPLLWLNVQQAMRPYLSVSTLGSVSVYAWHHRQLREAATRRYLSDAAFEHSIHAALSDLFTGRWAHTAKPFQYTAAQQTRFARVLKQRLGEEGFAQLQAAGFATAELRGVAAQPLFVSEADAQPNVRRASESFYHLMCAGSVEQAVCDNYLSFRGLQAKVLSVSLAQALSEVDDALAQLTGPLHRQLEVLREVIQMESGNLNLRALTLSTVLLCHLDLSKLAGDTSLLAVLLQDALQFGEAHNLLLPKRPSMRLAGGPLRRLFALPLASKQSKPISHIQVSEDGSILFAMYDDTFFTFDLATEVCRSTVPLAFRASFGGMLSNNTHVVTFAAVEKPTEQIDLASERTFRVACVNVSTGLQRWHAVYDRSPSAVLASDAITLVGVTSRLCVLDSNTGKEIMALELGAGADTVNQDDVIHCCALSGDDKLAYVCVGEEESCRLCVVDMATHAQLSASASPKLKSMALAGGDRYVVGVTYEGWSTLDLQTNTVVHKSDVYIRVLQTSSSTQAIGFIDQKLRVFDVCTGQEQHVFDCGWAPVTSLALLPKPNLVVAAGYDGQARFWSSVPPLEQDPTHRHASQINTITVLSSNTFVTGSTDQTLKVWRSDGTAALTHTLPAEVTVVLEVREDLLAVASGNTVRLLDVSGDEAQCKHELTWPVDIEGLKLVTIGDTPTFLVLTNVYNSTYPIACTWPLPAQLNGGSTVIASELSDEENKRWCHPNDRTVFLSQPRVLAAAFTWSAELAKEAMSQDLLPEMLLPSQADKVLDTMLTDDFGLCVLFVHEKSIKLVRFVGTDKASVQTLSTLEAYSMSAFGSLFADGKVFYPQDAQVMCYDMASAKEHCCVEPQSDIVSIVSAEAASLVRLVDSTKMTWFFHVAARTSVLKLPPTGDLESKLWLATPEVLVVTQHKLLSVYQLRGSGADMAAVLLGQVAAENWLAKVSAHVEGRVVRVLAGTADGEVTVFDCTLPALDGESVL